MRVTTKTLYQFAYSKFAVGAYNICSVEQFHGLFRGAEKSNAPIIVQFTKVARDYADAYVLAAMMDAAEKVYPDVVFAVHLDHGTEELCYDAIASGDYTSVMIDASHHPFEENIAITRRVVERAHEKGISVEAELGVLSGVEDDIAVDEEHAKLTNPDQAAEFVERIGCDSLAIAIGTSHGAYKFAGESKLHIERLAAIREKVPNFPFVLHGASEVPPTEVERINAAGGKMKATRGVDLNQLKQTIPRGVCKVNIGTDGRLVWSRVHREFFRDHPDQYDFALPGKLYMDAYAEFVDQKNRVLASAGHGNVIRESLKK